MSSVLAWVATCLAIYYVFQNHWFIGGFAFVYLAVYLVAIYQSTSK